MLILINSHESESQVSAVTFYLKQMGHDPVLFERYRRDHFITYYLSNDSVQAKICINGYSYPLNSHTFPAVWSRIKPIISSEIPGEAAPIAEKFCMQEWRHALSALDVFLPNSRWINPPAVDAQLSRKIYQLQLAQRCGLLIPSTIVTNRADELLYLFKNNRVIYKTLSSFFTSTESIYTNEVSAAQIQAGFSAIAMAPGIYQPLLNKAYELRVMMVGQRVFTARINSQTHASTTLDWRHAPDQAMFAPSQLSTVTEQQLRLFHVKSGLVYAAYDFIVDHAGREIFLECNPAGQWLWLEKKLGLNVAEAMALELTQGG